VPPDALFIFPRALVSSAFAKFGNQTVSLPLWLYLPWLALLAVGLTVGAWHVRTRGVRVRRIAAWLVSACVLSFLLVVYECFFVDFSPQGRYVLLPALLLTLVAVWAPAEASTATWARLWPTASVGFLLVAAAWSEALLLLRPCG
jgi:hypothetical protein